MKILVVSAYFHPMITPRAFRTTELVKELCKRGHQVVVYIPFSNYDYSSFGDYNLKILFFGKRSLSISLPNGKNVFSKGIRCIYRLFSHYTEYPYIKCYFNIPRMLSGLTDNFDVLISIAAPHAVHWGVCKALEYNPNLSKLWIADCGDPFMGDSVSKHPFYFKYFEKKFSQRADFITVPVESAKKAYYQDCRNKIRVIPQGFDFAPFVGIENYYKKHTIPTFAYAGSLYRGYRDLDNLIDYLSTKDNFLFILYTPQSTLVNSYKNKLGNKLEVRPLIPRIELIKELARMDFLVNIENLGSVQVPSKLIDYGLTKRPILQVSRRIDKLLVDEFLDFDFHRGYVVENLSQYNIMNVVDEFYKLFH